MNLLLLLSALLSALTGAVGARTGGVPQAVCSRSAEVLAEQAVNVIAGARPDQALPQLAELRLSVALPFRLSAAVPLYANRRRE